MKRIQAFKFELMPSGEQERVCAASLISRRFVYNEAPDLRIKRHKRGEKNLSYAGLCKELTGWRNASTTHWLADSPIHTL
ncbi:MAG: helix-turn-helix domain-containing protein, partial [Chloracidobacterium sp.]|nr:helix-turn-helix domain-containing protein [Chloracidobacterium sp.]